MQPLFGAEASAALLRSPEEISDPVELLGPSGIESWAVETGSAYSLAGVGMTRKEWSCSASSLLAGTVGLTAV